MATTPKKQYKLKDCLGLEWDRVDPYARDTCDFCKGPIYYDGHWVGRTQRSPREAVMVACRSCAQTAGLEW